MIDAGFDVPDYAGSTKRLLKSKCERFGWKDFGHLAHTASIEIPGAIKNIFSGGAGKRAPGGHVPKKAVF